jgi:uncharacterized membrane protein
LGRADRWRKLQSEYLLDLEDAVVAVKDKKGQVKLRQAVNLTAAGAVSGGFWGSLIGLIFLNPLLGLAMGPHNRPSEPWWESARLDPGLVRSIATQVDSG